MSKHIAFVNIPAHGHVNPTLAVARELVDRGYRVSYVTTEEFVPAITAAGATPLLYRSAFLEGMKYAKNTPKDPHPAHILHQFLDEMKAGLPQLEALFQHDKPDLLVHDYLAWSAKVFAGKAGIPAIQTNPTFVENEHFSMDKKFAKVQPFHPTIVTFMFKLLFFLNKQKTKSLTLGTFFNDPTKTCIAFFPRAFQFEGDTFHERFAFVGPCLTEREFQGTWQPPVEQKPVLLIALGTASKVGIDFYKTCIEAFADSRWHVVMAVGKKIAPASLGTLPANVEVHQQVPQLAILPHCEAFLSHGGMNSTMEAMYYGVPLVVIPSTKEQEAIAYRVDELGLGRSLTHEAVTVDALREAVQHVATDEGVAARVRDMQQKVRDAGGAVTAADEIESFMKQKQR